MDRPSHSEHMLDASLRPLLTITIDHHYFDDGVFKESLSLPFALMLSPLVTRAGDCSLEGDGWYTLFILYYTLYIQVCKSGKHWMVYIVYTSIYKSGKRWMVYKRPTLQFVFGSELYTIQSSQLQC